MTTVKRDADCENNKNGICQKDEIDLYSDIWWHCNGGYMETV